MTEDLNSSALTAPAVRRRRVYYISGFDPRGARFYHQLYTTEAQRQAPINGYQYTVGRRQKTGQHAVTWSVCASAEGASPGALGTETQYTFLSWDDLVRANWPVKTWCLVPRCFGALVSPLVYLILAMGAVAAISGAVYSLVWQLVTAGGLAWVLAAAAGVSTAAGVARAALAGAEKLRLPWLMRIFLFVPQWGRSPGGALADRWDVMAAQIAADLAADAAQTPAAPAEEVLIIGHSVGALAALCVACGLAPSLGATLQIKSSRFGKMLTPAEHARRRRDAFGIHFQYLTATQLPVDNDYFTLTAGPRALVVVSQPVPTP